MATLVIDPVTGKLVRKDSLTSNKNKEDINKNLYTGTDETDIELPDAEDNNEVSGATAFAAGLASGVIKVGEGVVSLGAELIDLGVDTDTAASVEQFFDDHRVLQTSVLCLDDYLLHLCLHQHQGAI